MSHENHFMFYNKSIRGTSFMTRAAYKKTSYIRRSGSALVAKVCSVRIVVNRKNV